MPRLDVESLPAALRNPHRDGRLIFTFKQVCQADGLESMPRADFSVVRLVDEPQGQDALFLNLHNQNFSGE